MTLATAAEALERGDVVEALAEALAAWRARRAPAVAAAIEELGALVPPVAPLTAATGGKQEKELAARAAEDEPADFGLLATTPLPRTFDAFAARMRALAAREPDPRFTALLHRMLAKPPFAHARFFRLMFELLVDAGDPRSPAVLDELDLDGTARGSELATIERARVAALAEMDRRVPKPADTTQLARLTKAIAAHARSRPRTSGDDLLAEIRARPDDDRLYAVYADYLQERGDPLGELIALQLAGTDERRVKALLAAHGKRWLGPIAGIAVLGRTRFERGFPAVVAVKEQVGTAGLRAAVGAPEWAGVRELTFSPVQTELVACADIVCHPAMRSLRVVRGLGPAPAAKIAAAKPPLRLTTLGTTGFRDKPGALATCTGLPELERIELERADQVRALYMVVRLLASPVARRLRSIALVSDAITLELAGAGLRRLRVIPGTLDPDILAGRTRELADLAGAVSEIEIVVEERVPDELAALLAPLGVLPRTITRG